MCSTSFLRSLPKCEHHIHVEGALSPELLFRLADKNHVELPKDDPAFASIDELRMRYARFTSLDDFLHYYYIGMSTLIHASDYEQLAWDYFQRAAADGVAHAELFFDPQAHLSRGVSYDTLLTGLTAARRRAEVELSISSEIICCFLRHLPPADSMNVFGLKEVQSSLHQGDVAGIGLDSSELNFGPMLFTDIYQAARTQGFKRTAHAGEEGPATYIADALDHLHVQRIDHGIHLIDDPALLARVAKEGTLLSVCPISNVFLRCVSSVADLPIRKFLDAGVAFSINSDDPAYFGGNYILDNYVAVQEAFHLSVAEWERICRASIRGSWCGEDRKRELNAKLDAALKEQRQG